MEEGIPGLRDMVTARQSSLFILAFSQCAKG